jgi:hypothetical protein
VQFLAAHVVLQGADGKRPVDFHDEYVCLLS